jgi:DNA-binding transcriptional regulator YdaS (Cro superfamily)
MSKARALAIARAIKIIGGQRATAKAIGVTQPAVSQMLARGNIRAELVLPLERACARAAKPGGPPPPTRYELRPDIFRREAEARLRRLVEGSDGLARLPPR